jgi:hypothetical protein
MLMKINARSYEDLDVGSKTVVKCMANDSMLVSMWGAFISSAGLELKIFKARVSPRFLAGNFDDDADRGRKKSSAVSTKLE